jgi:peptide/nickel transport system permease protein
MVLRVPLALWRAVTANRKVATGSSIVGFFLLVSVLEPLVVRTDPDTYSHLTLQPPSSAHWLGTTQTGQDVLMQLIAGTQSSMFWGIATGAIVTLISVAVGLVGGYLGGSVDEALSLLTNVFLVIPGLPLAIVLAAFLQRGPLTIALVITITGWAWGARVLRSQTLTMRSREFVTAARANGESTVRIIFFEILPNEISIVAVNFIFVVLNVILAWAALEFLGLGDISTVSWGSMLYWAQNNGALILGAWWWFVPPGLCIALVGAGLALINFGIDEIADPRLRQGTRPRRFKRKKARVA